jgi:U3 small nucleolar RNA-associated protein 21
MYNRVWLTDQKSVAISPCGTFAVIGSEGGCIDMFNLQSGLHRQSFPSRPTSLKSYQPSSVRHSALPVAKNMGNFGSTPPEEQHSGEVSGLTIDSLNRIVVSSGLDGKIKVRTTFVQVKRRTQPDICSFGIFSQGALFRKLTGPQ